MEDVPLTPDLVAYYLRRIDPETGKKYTQSKIALLTGKSRQAVSKVAIANNLREKTPREIAMEHYPWIVNDAFHESSIDRRMRDHFEYIATAGTGMQSWKLERLRTFYRHIVDHDLVVEFDPSIPPVDGPTPGWWEGDSVGGFAFRPREPSDDDLIIRVNQHTNLTEEGRILLLLPPILP